MAEFENRLSDQQEDKIDIISTFPYILESGALKKVVCEDLGVSSLPGTTGFCPPWDSWQIREQPCWVM